VFGGCGGGGEVPRRRREHGCRLHITWTAHAYVWSKMKKKTGTII